MFCTNVLQVYISVSAGYWLQWQLKVRQLCEETKLCSEKLTKIVDRCLYQSIHHCVWHSILKFKRIVERLGNNGCEPKTNFGNLDKIVAIFRWQSDNGSILETFADDLNISDSNRHAANNRSFERKEFLPWTRFVGSVGKCCWIWLKSESDNFIFPSAFVSRLISYTWSEH